jgi:hypothetical protein
MADKKEPMIGRESRPTAMDFDAPISNFKLRDLYAVIHGHFTEKEIVKVEKEHFKPEKEKEYFKPEKELFKPPELLKPERLKPEYFKPEKELLKPEKELSKPEKPIDEGVIDEIATRVAEKLRGQGFK